jgi:coatomer subunit delta
MVVLAAAITTKAGKVLLSRQYRELSRIRIEGLLAAFPKLIGAERQHTYVETDSVRYVYQPVETLYVLLVTTNNSNIVEDLETLRLLSKLLPEYTPRYGTVDEESVMDAAFELIYSFDEVIDWRGLRENVDLQMIATFTEMYSHEERLVKMIQESKMQEAKEARKLKEQEIRKARSEGMGRGLGRSGGDGLGQVGNEIGRRLHQFGMGNFAADLGLSTSQGSRAQASMAYAAAGGISSDSYAQQAQAQALGMGGGGVGGGGMVGIGNGMGGGGGGMGGSAPMGVPMSLGMGGPPTSAGYGRSAGTVPVAAAAGKRGMSLGLGKARKNDTLLDSLRAEGEVVDEAVGGGPVAGGGGRSAAPAAAAAYAAATPLSTAPVQLSAVEKISLVVNRDGGVQNMEVKGDLLLRVTDPAAAQVRLAVATGDAAGRGVQFKTHPNVNRTLFVTEGIVGLKDATKPFPTTAVTANPLAVLRWRFVSKEESAAPLLINCWPSDGGSESTVNIEYELGSTPASRDLRHVVISVPVGSASQPTVSQCDGEFVYNARAQCVEWHLAVIDDSNRTGSLEFTTGQVSAEAFFPVSVSFTTKFTYAQVVVSSVSGAETGEPVEFAYESTLTPESFTIV